MDNKPYNSLQPNLILNAIDSIGFQCNGSLFALNSFENRVYQIGIEESPPIIAKFYRPQRWSDAAILEEHQFSAELAAHEVPVIAPLVAENGDTLHHYENFRFALFPRKGGHALELDSLDQLEWMGRFIGRLHAIGACQTFQHRLRLDVQTYGYTPYHYLIEHEFIPVEFKQKYCEIIEAVLQQIEKIFQQYKGINFIRLHGDCHAGNVLWHNGPQIVDLDDCLMGPAIQDIWMLISGNSPQEIQLQLNTILRGYQEFYDFDFREIQLIEALRSLRMIHYSGWLAKRWEDPAFPLNFPWFNTLNYWQEQIRDLQEQLSLMLEQRENNLNFYEI